jgi:outer membrane protein TolC
MDAGIEAGVAGVRAATATFLPTLSLGIDYGFQGPEVAFRSDQDYWVGSLILSWDLFHGGRDVARRSAARLQVDQARTLRTDLEDRIALEVRTTYEAAVVAREAIATANDRLESARRTFELVRRRYEEGIASPIELVDARTALTSAELNLAVTTYGYAMRRVDLERAAALRTLPF